MGIQLIVARTLDPESELADAGTRPPPRAPSLPLHRSSSGLTGGSLPAWAALVDAARGLAEREQNQRLQVDGPRFEPDPPVKPEDDDGGEARAVSTRRRVSEPLVCDAGYQTSDSMKPQILAASEQPTGNRSSRLRELDQSRPDMIRILDSRSQPHGVSSCTVAGRSRSIVSRKTAVSVRRLVATACPPYIAAPGNGGGTPIQCLAVQRARDCMYPPDRRRGARPPSR